MKWLRACLIMLMLGVSGGAFAVQPGEQLPDAGQEARARKLSAQLRCLVCQNQSIDDSDASLARDLRLLVRERIKAGDDDATIRAFLVARYGEFVLLTPGLSAQTALLWGMPLLALVFGGFAAHSLFLRRLHEEELQAPDMALTAEELSALDIILDRNPETNGKTDTNKSKTNRS